MMKLLNLIVTFAGGLQRLSINGEVRMDRKIIQIDTNSVNDNGNIFVQEIIAKYMKLKDGEAVIAYQESDEWDAEVIFENGQCGIILKSDARTISLERQKGHSEGFWSGVYLQTSIIFHTLDAMDVDMQLKIDLKKRLGLL